MGFGEGRVMWRYSGVLWVNNVRNGTVVWDHNNSSVIWIKVTVTVR